MAVAHRPPAPQDHRADGGVGDQKPGAEPALGVDVHHRLGEVEPSAGQREPDLVDRLLGAEQDRVPAHRVVRVAQRRERGDLGGRGDPGEDALGEVLVRLGVDADRQRRLRRGNRRRTVSRAVRDAAGHADRPDRCAPLAARDRDGRHADRGERAPGAVAPGDELPPSPVGDPLDERPLLREEGLLRDVAELLRRRHPRRQDVSDHVAAPASTRRGRVGPAGRPRHSRG